MGPYYLTALVHALGPVRRVAAITSRARDRRTISSEPHAGEGIEVKVDTHAAGTLEFHSGAVVTMVMSFDVWGHSNRFIEIHGTDASLSAPDPNRFGGTVRVSPGRGEWQDQPLTHGYTDNMRSIGLADMCVGIRTGRRPSLQRPAGAARIGDHGGVRHFLRRAAARRAGKQAGTASAVSYRARPRRTRLSCSIEPSRPSETTAA